jgi:hypothetical protein
LLSDHPDIKEGIQSISFAAVPHRGSWAALLVPVWPAAFDMMPFSKKLKKTKEAPLPAKTKNFLPALELKIWPKRSARLDKYENEIVPRTNHDSLVGSREFAEKVIKFIKE